jgi:4-hydroxymandelate oxidase
LDLTQALNPSKSADQALSVMEFEELARKALPPAHFAYLATGVDDDATVRLNHEAYQHIEIRSRRLIDAAKLDCSVDLFGTKWETPIFLCPVSSMKSFRSRRRSGGRADGGEQTQFADAFDRRRYVH